LKPASANSSQDPIKTLYKKGLAEWLKMLATSSNSNAAKKYINVNIKNIITDPSDIGRILIKYK
jgi:hypothetical protein